MGVRCTLSKWRTNCCLFYSNFPYISWQNLKKAARLKVYSYKTWEIIAAYMYLKGFFFKMQKNGIFYHCSCQPYYAITFLICIIQKCQYMYFYNKKTFRKGKRLANMQQLFVICNINFHHFDIRTLSCECYTCIISVHVVICTYSSMK